VLEDVEGKYILVKWTEIDTETECSLRVVEPFTMAEAQELARKLAGAITQAQHGG
jgi:hypothetical protein